MQRPDEQSLHFAALSRQVHNYYLQSALGNPVDANLKIYDKSIWYLVTRFLIESGFVNFGFDGGITHITTGLPAEKELNSMIVTFLERRVQSLNSEAANQGIINNSFFNKNPSTQLVPSPSSHRIEAPSTSQPGREREEKSGRNKVQISDWHVDQVVESLRLLHECYINTDCRKVAILVAHAKLQRFTGGNCYSSKKDVLTHFNSMLTRHGFIRQIGVKITSIRVNADKKLPSDSELETILMNYKKNYNSKRKNYNPALFSQNQPQSSGTTNRMAINFLLNEEREVEFSPLNN